MTTLTQYGWTDLHAAFFNTNAQENLSPGRVISIQGFKYYVISENGELETELSGKLLFGAIPEELPKVGDWVSFMNYDTMGYIIHVFPRTNELSRKAPGTKTEKQVLATNIDYALIVQGLDRDFNIMRLERYLVQLSACSIRPVVVLNKADLINDQEFYRNEITRLQRDCEVHFCSTVTGFGIEALQTDVLVPDKTYMLLGSSGVGKSSLLNALMTGAVQKTSPTSDSTNKGRHTTTTRDLFRLPNGSLIIDAPGMREFGLTHEEGQASGDLFPAIRKLAEGCRFSDCRHLNEHGCAVLEAVHSGAFDADVYASYLKLLKEQRRFEISAEDKKRMGKQFGKITREAKNYRKKYKY